MSDNSDLIPKKSVGDYAHTAVKAAISMIPVAGGPAAELFALVIAPPLQRRRDAWMEDLYERLKGLEERVADFHVEDLQHNDAFVSATLQATQIALRTHQEIKRDALQNALANIALGNAPDDDTQQMFLSYVDNLTAWHIRILAFFRSPGKEFETTRGITPNRYGTSSLAQLLEEMFPQLQGRRSFYDQIATDLHSRGLTGTQSLHGMMTAQGVIAKRTTEAGDEFLAFISGPATTI